MHACMHACMYVCMYVCIHVRICMYMYVYMYVYVYIYIYMYLSLSIYIHIRDSWSSLTRSLSMLISAEDLQRLYDKIAQLEQDILNRDNEINMLNDRVKELQESLIYIYI